MSRMETYIRLFQQIKTWLTQFSASWDFETYLSDHDKGAYLAAKEVFPRIGEEGCFFHLCKRLDFHVKQLGLLPKYSSDLEFKVRVKKLAALAFVSLSVVVPDYESLSTSFLPDELPILHYFGTTWIGLKVAGQRMVPVLHVMWNVYHRHTHG